MGKKTIKVEVPVEEVKVEEIDNHVIQHLDRDPHDPRLVSTDRPLPSLND